MVLGRVVGWFTGSSELTWPQGQPVKLPSYFPVQPKGCESQSQKLFDCVTEKATERHRDMENAGYHKSYYPDIVETQPKDPKYAQYVRAQNEKPADDATKDTAVPRPDENPLAVCTQQILVYQKCCERALKKKQNWILTEPYRVQKEYRYKGGGAETV